MKVPTCSEKLQGQILLSVSSDALKAENKKQIYEVNVINDK